MRHHFTFRLFYPLWLLTFASLLLVICTACAPSYAPITPEKVGYFSGEASPQTLKTLTEKFETAKRAENFPAAINLCQAATGVALSIGDTVHAAEMAEKGLNLLATLEKEKRNLPNRLNISECPGNLSEKDMNLCIERWILEKRQRFLQMLLQSSASRGDMSRVTEIKQKMDRVEQRLSALPEETYFLKQSNPALRTFFEQAKQAHGSVGIGLNEKMRIESRLEKSWYKMSPEKRRLLVQEAVETCLSRSMLVHPQLNLELRALNVKPTVPLCKPYYTYRLARLSPPADVVKIEVRASLAQARWVRKAYPQKYRCSNMFAPLGEIFMMSSQDLARVEPDLFKESIQYLEECSSDPVVKPLFNAYYLSKIFRVMEKLKLRSYKMEQLFQRTLDKEEAQRLFLVSEIDRRSKAAALQELIDAGVSYYFNSGNYEKALALALRGKSRTLMDMIVAGAKVEKPRMNVGDIARSYGENRRGIAVRLSGGKKVDLADIRMRGGATVPPLKEIIDSIPQKTVVVETYAAQDALYLWLLTREGIREVRKLNLSRKDVGSLVWNYRMKLLHREHKDNFGFVDLQGTLDSEGTAHISAKNPSPFYAEVLLVATEYGNSEYPAIPKSSYIKPFSTTEIATFQPFQEVFTVHLVTDYGEARATFQAIKGKLRKVADEKANKLQSAFSKTPEASSLKTLFDILQKAIPCKQLLIAPHHVLWYVPFSSLRINGSYLVQKKPLALIPSSAILPYLTEENKNKRNQQALVFGDPRNPMVSGLAPLPGARKEAIVISSMFPKASLFLGDKAREDLFKTRSPYAGLLHLATHAVFTSSRPKDSFVLLAPSAEDDGRLTIREILQLSLKDKPLVVLSACETGISYLGSGEELLGLHHAFLISGASGVLASLWKIDDIATQKLMKAFYEAYLSGKSPVEALQQAQLKLLHGPMSDPSNWAAFYYVF